jgi:hypothetical protein
MEIILNLRLHLTTNQAIFHNVIVALDKILHTIVIAIIMIVAFSGGFLIAGKTPQNLLNSASKNGNSFFDNQNASLTGKITKINNGTMTVQNKKGASQSFPVSDTIIINKIDEKTGLPTSPSKDINTLELNKEVVISLISQNGEFKIMSINYLPNASNFTNIPQPKQSSPLPSTQPKATTSAQPSNRSPQP